MVYGFLIVVAKNTSRGSKESSFEDVVPGEDAPMKNLPKKD
jgi:hypothetical protein